MIKASTAGVMQPDKKSLGLQLLVLIGLGFSLTQCSTQPEPTGPKAIDLATPKPTVAIYNWPNDGATVAQAHVVTIPPNYPVEVAVSEELKTVAAFATETDALAILNGGFFDPNNGQTTSFVMINGTLVADPQDNQRLMDNPDLAIYLEQILNRSEFRRYSCADHISYDITFHNAPIPQGCNLHSALGAGPQLLPNDTSQREGFTDYDNGTLIRDAIGSQQRNARSAIGIQSDGTLIGVMVAQSNPAGGMTLAELAEFMHSLGAQKVLNLDGGSSSSIHAPGLANGEEARTYYGRLDQQGQKIQRPVKSVLLIPQSADE
ncbi:phosphodiester glycosidase family protein [Leptothoe sp. PORK10 BA2]|uniref:phosphodiester glycosidase family protein n=1 Tax=Leptothoe sp. PORK10 BA2 TaxID=3110254 RepID=UPI002B1F09ED|nr:phosphodiester glycosidase family protein [Leptothoe sp. PORK10 BA2]